MEFQYRICRKPKLVLEKVCGLAQDKIVLSGNEQQGRFTGLFEGSYRVIGEYASIEITKKPIFVSWSMVNKGLKFLMA